MLNRVIVLGGAGGLGGRGRQCVFVKYVFKCATARMIGRGPQGKRGPKGTSGNSKFYTDTGTLLMVNTRERVDVFQKDVSIL